MAKISSKKIKDLLKKYLKEAGVNYQQIILFGSFAKRNKKFNDIDIVIISSDFEGRTLWERAELIGDIHWKLVNFLKTPLDILTFSLKEWEEENSPIISYIKA